MTVRHVHDMGRETQQDHRTRSPSDGGIRAPSAGTVDHHPHEFPTGSAVIGRTRVQPDFGRVPILPPPHHGEKTQDVTVSKPGDPDEQEASRMADAVVRMPNGSSFQARERQASTPPERPGPVASQATGRPLDRATRAFFEPRLGFDLGRVRILVDSQAARSAERLQARAFTIGNQIVFGRNAYEPQNSTGRALLAHELVHVARHSATRPAQVFRSEGPGDATQRAEVQRLTEEMGKLAAKNAWAGVDRNYRQIEALGENAFTLSGDPANLHFLAAQAARNLGDSRRYKSLLQRARTALLESGRTADDPALTAVDQELSGVDQQYGTVRISPRAKRLPKAGKGEPVGPELLAEQMPFGGDQRASIEHARQALAETGEFSGMLPIGRYTVGGESFQVIPGTNIDILWGTEGK